jgi:hypothetical protein
LEAPVIHKKLLGATSYITKNSDPNRSAAGWLGKADSDLLL